MMILILILILPLIMCWGPDGHIVVARIAERRLLNTSLLLVRSLLGDSSMEDVANWADEYRHTPEGSWSENLHFADLPFRNCSFSRSRDCVNEICVAGAIANYSNRLHGIFRQPEDLKLLIHFMGDGHQPLHAGFQSDRGGNALHVDACFHAKTTCHRDNLHSLWDTYIIRQMESTNASAFADALIYKLTTAAMEDQVVEWESTCARGVIECSNRVLVESAINACQVAYSFPTGGWVENGDELMGDYYTSSSDTIQLRLMAAGVRLAALINDISSRLDYSNTYPSATMA